jgi:hypothetical protein
MVPPMPPLSRIAEQVGWYAAWGWLIHCGMRADQSSLSALSVVLSVEPLRSALVAGLVGGLATPLTSRLARIGGPHHLRGLGAAALFGAATTLGILCLRYLAWPAAWQGSRLEAWKTVATVVGVYGWALFPIALFGGATAGWLARRPARPALDAAG